MNLDAEMIELDMTLDLMARYFTAFDRATVHPNAPEVSRLEALDLLEKAEAEDASQ